MAFPIEGPVWFVGCGNMGGAILARWLAAGLDPAQVTVIDPAAPALPGVTVLAVPPPDGAVPALLLLAVKPQTLDAVAGAIAPLLGPETLLVSILAGVEVAALRRRFEAPRIVRAMPNTPVAIGRGAVSLYGPELGPELERVAETLMAPLGLVEWVDESLFDVVTALSGSGPAFLFRFIDALAAAGADAGLDPDQSARLALATVVGAGLLAEGSGESPHALAERVASPGGSTRKGLDVLDEPSALRALLRDTLDAAILRNRELAEAAR